MLYYCKTHCLYGMPRKPSPRPNSDTVTLNVRHSASSGDLKGFITSSTASPALFTQITSRSRRSSRKKLSNCSARIPRFVLRALKHDDTVKYVKGAEVPITDALSRVSPQPAPPEGEFPQLDIQQIIENLPASPIKLQQIRNETANEPTLSKLFDVIHQQWSATREKCSNALHNFREELTIEDGLILKQERIVMPNTLSTSRAIINHLKSIFAEHGIPERVTTNGPQFASQEFLDFMQTYAPRCTPSLMALQNAWFRQ